MQKTTHIKIELTRVVENNPSRIKHSAYEYKNETTATGDAGLVFPV